MVICPKCGIQLNDDAAFCPYCGSPMQAAGQASPPPPPRQQQQQQQQYYQYQAPPGQNNQQKSGNPFNDVVDITDQFDPYDIQENKTVAFLSYLGILVLVPLLAVKQSPFAQFHAKQGVTLCIFWLAYSVITSIINFIGIGFISVLLGFASLFLIALSIIGIVNATSGKAKELPIIGSLHIIK